MFKIQKMSPELFNLLRTSQRTALIDQQPASAPPPPTWSPTAAEAVVERPTASGCRCPVSASVLAGARGGGADIAWGGQGGAAGSGQGGGTAGPASQTGHGCCPYAGQGTASAPGMSDDATRRPLEGAGRKSRTRACPGAESATEFHDEEIIEP